MSQTLPIIKKQFDLSTATLIALLEEKKRIVLADQDLKRVDGSPGFEVRPPRRVSQILLGALNPEIESASQECARLEKEFQAAYLAEQTAADA